MRLGGGEGQGIYKIGFLVGWVLFVRWSVIVIEFDFFFFSFFDFFLFLVVE